VRDVPGKTMFQRIRYLLEAHADDLRKLMPQELRGNPASNCNLIHTPMHA
jgi:proline racemase